MRQRSPFPGMDPWLEEHWGDIHHSIIQYCRDQIAGHLPGDLFATVEETVYIHTDEEDDWLARPDMGIYAIYTEPDDRQTSGAATATLAKPVHFRAIEQSFVEGTVEIRKIGSGEPLVTAIEVLSPTNKVDRRGREDYLNKRAAYHRGKVNVVEIDFLRSGEHLVDVIPDQIPPRMATAYRASVRRANARHAEYYPLPLRERLPSIAIPLRRSDQDVPLDLQAPIDEAYAKGSYANRIDYGKPPKPPLSAEDAAWAAEAVRSARA